MHSIKLTPLEIMNIAAHWSVVDDDNFKADDNNGALIDVTADELASLHPQLPQALRVLNARSKLMEPECHTVAGSNLFYTLAALKDGLISLKDKDGNDVNFIDIVSVTGCPSEPGAPLCTKVMGMLVDVEYFRHGKKALPFVINWVGDSVRVPNTELEQHYAGWSKRLNLGEELGLDTEALMNFVFNRGQSPVVDGVVLSDITFD